MECLWKHENYDTEKKGFAHIRYFPHNDTFYITESGMKLGVGRLAQYIISEDELPKELADRLKAEAAYGGEYLLMSVEDGKASIGCF